MIQCCVRTGDRKDESLFKAYLIKGPSTFVIFLKMYFLMVEHEHFVHTQVEYVLLENDSFY